MVDEVGALGQHRVIVTADGRERELDAFLAELLRNAARSFTEEPRGIAAVRALLDTARNNSFELTQERLTPEDLASLGRDLQDQLPPIAPAP